MRSQFQHDTGRARSSATRRLGKWWPQTRPAGLKGEPQTEPGHEWIDCAVRKKIARSKGPHLSDHRLRIGHIEEIYVRYQVPPIAQKKVARYTQIEHVHAGEPADAGGLKKYGLPDRYALPGRDPQGPGRPDRENRIMVEIEAGSGPPLEVLASYQF